MDLGLNGKACVVTGASIGIGLAVSERLAQEGASVLMVARDEERLAEAAARAGADYIAADVTDPDADERIIATCVERNGGIDVLVNNAGANFARPLDELTDDDWNGLWALHVLAPMRLMRAAAPRMADRGGGRIINVCSSAGKRPSLLNAAYSVTKSAQLALSRVFADTYARQGVLVNAVAPGATESPHWMAPGGLADQIAATRGVDREAVIGVQNERMPLGRFARPHEIGDVIVFLCSASASAVLGAAWSVDGGTVPVII